MPISGRSMLPSMQRTVMLFERKGYVFAENSTGRQRSLVLMTMDEMHLEQGQVSALLAMRPEAPQVSKGTNGAITHCHANPSHVIPAAKGQF